MNTSKYSNWTILPACNQKSGNCSGFFSVEACNFFLKFKICHIKGFFLQETEYLFTRILGNIHVNEYIRFQSWKVSIRVENQSLFELRPFRTAVIDVEIQVKRWSCDLRHHLNKLFFIFFFTAAASVLVAGLDAVIQSGSLRFILSPLPCELFEVQLSRSDFVDLSGNDAADVLVFVCVGRLPYAAWKKDPKLPTSKRRPCVLV